ncbi:MAG: hypothetical protein Q9159_001169 [Coniocarpon cinnabarinum]
MRQKIGLLQRFLRHQTSQRKDEAVEVAEDDDYKFGIEIECYLRPKRFNGALIDLITEITSHKVHHEDESLATFAEKLVHNYRWDIRCFNSRYAGAIDMQNYVGATSYPIERYQFWTLERDVDIEISRAPPCLSDVKTQIGHTAEHFQIGTRTLKPTLSSRKPWLTSSIGGIEIISPILKPSTWRTVMDPTWRFLEEHYQIITDEECGTHVHVSKKGGITVEDAKRVAIACIYWEPAWLAIVPRTRHGKSSVQSFWFENLNYAAEGVSREQLIQRIQDIKETDAPTHALHRLSRMLQPDGYKNWQWNFGNLLGDCGTIECRLCPGSEFGFF